ncbi:MAG: CHAD domain-containing protein [bacterium]|nr:CHAD domain-containing protein [bacterium]
MASDPDKAALLWLADAARSRRRAAYRSIRRMVGERWFNGLLFDLLLAVEGGGLIRPDQNGHWQLLAARVLEKRYKGLIKLSAGCADLSSADRHEVRIALKK